MLNQHQDEVTKWRQDLRELAGKHKKLVEKMNYLSLRNEIDFSWQQFSIEGTEVEFSSISTEVETVQSGSLLETPCSIEIDKIKFNSLCGSGNSEYTVEKSADPFSSFPVLRPKQNKFCWGRNK